VLLRRGALTPAGVHFLWLGVAEPILQAADLFDAVTYFAALDGAFADNIRDYRVAITPDCASSDSTPAQANGRSLQRDESVTVKLCAQGGYIC
jgi:hypothetical protein